MRLRGSDPIPCSFISAFPVFVLRTTWHESESSRQLQIDISVTQKIAIEPDVENRDECYISHPEQTSKLDNANKMGNRLMIFLLKKIYTHGKEVKRNYEFEVFRNNLLSKTYLPNPLVFDLLFTSSRRRITYIAIDFLLKIR